MVDFCENGNEVLGTIKAEHFLTRLIHNSVSRETLHHGANQ